MQGLTLLMVTLISIKLVCLYLVQHMLESLKFTIFAGLNTVNGGLNRYKIVVLLFGAAYAASNEGITILF